MKSLAFFSFAALVLIAPACATPLDGRLDEGGSDETDTGGTSSGGGGLLVTGGSTSATGGVTNASGGAASGGAASGGAGTGGATYEGDCADKPTFAAWKATMGMTGDQVVYVCTAAQAACAGKTVGTPYLWSCAQAHVPNCQTQAPQDSDNSWTYVGECTSEGMGGGGS